MEMTSLVQSLCKYEASSPGKVEELDNDFIQSSLGFPASHDVVFGTFDVT